MPSLLPRRAPDSLAAMVATGHRSSSPDTGVDALREVDEATPGFAARYGLQGCALTSVSARQGTRCSGLPLAPPSSYPGALPAPGAGLPPASSNVSTACSPVPFSGKPHWEPGDVLADNGGAKVSLFFVGGGKWTLDAPMAELELATGSVVRRFEALAPMSARASQASRAFQGRLPREVATEVVGWARQGEF